MTYSSEIINLFLEKYINGNKITNISKELNISRKTAYNWIEKYNSNLENKISVINNITIRKTNKKKLYENQIINYVNNNEGCTLNNLYEHLKKDISKSTIINVLKEHKISHKKIKNNIIGKEMNKIIDDRKKFSNELNKEDFMNGIHIDESSININDYKNYGYSKLGKKIKFFIKHKRTKEKITLLKAISKNKIIHYELIDENVNSEIYLNFIKNIIEKNPEYLNKTLFQDNARIHHSKIVKKYSKKHNINLKYNPAYSPEFNPIENIFSKIKTIYRNIEHTDIKKSIIQSINSIKTEDLINCYEHSYKIILSYK